MACRPPDPCQVRWRPWRHSPHHQCFLCGAPSPGCGHPPPKSPACTCTISTFCAAFLLLHMGILYRKVLHALAPSALSVRHSFSWMWAVSTVKSCMHLHHQHFLCSVLSRACGHPPPKSPACSCTISTFCAAFLLLHVGILHRKVLHALAPSVLPVRRSFSWMWASSTEKSCMHLHHQHFLCSISSLACGHPPPKSPACTCTISTLCAAFLLLHVGILHQKVLHALAPSALSVQHSFKERKKRKKENFLACGHSPP